MIPHERSLVKRLEGRPFALIGVNTDQDRGMVKSRSVEDQVTWRSFYDKTTRGPICREWQVSGFPTIYIIDHKGVIRYKNLRGEQMDAAVDKLLAEMALDKQ
jgi:hypothetical protein